MISQAILRKPQLGDVPSRKLSKSFRVDISLAGDSPKSLEMGTKTEIDLPRQSEDGAAARPDIQ